MYESFYGLLEKPFQKTPDPRFFFRSETHQEALDRLLYAVEEREIAVLVGEVGTGKTMLTRALLDELDEERHPTAILLDPRLSVAHLRRVLAQEWGVTHPRRNKADLWNQLSDKLMEYYEAGVLPVAIIEEAQLINRSEVFDELRLLTNFQLDHANLCSLIIVGQPELKAKLRTDRLRAFRQRIGIQYQLPALSESGTTQYIQHRLKVAGRSTALFTNEALAALYRHSHGLPRSLNNLAGMALVAGFAKEAHMIDRSLIDEVSGEVEARWEVTDS